MTIALPRATRHPAPPLRSTSPCSIEQGSDAERSGRALDGLAWHQALALWKAAIFLEGSFKRYLAASTDDAFFAGLATGVPALADAACELTETGGVTPGQ